MEKKNKTTPIDREIDLSGFKIKDKLLNTTSFD